MLVGDKDWRGKIQKFEVSTIVVDEFHTISRGRYVQIVHVYGMYDYQIRNYLVYIYMLKVGEVCFSFICTILF